MAEKKAAKKSAKKLYWKNPIYFEELGTVRGEVTAEAKKLFAKTPAKLEDWTTDHDVEAAREAVARAKMRKQLGLPEEK